MQAQQTRNITKPISQTQSLAAVQTLLSAALGAITFLRNLLPEDNFSKSHFAAQDGSFPPSGSFSSVQSDLQEQGDKRHATGFKIMTMTRGYTDEADRLLNYLEYGIFDALEKQYLKSFIFAIYLDNRDPNNIIEAYTFNFKYHTLSDGKTSVPIMSLGDQNSKVKHYGDAVTKAIQSGKAPTLKDVKQSVKTMLKTLIHAMNHMDVLPKRRFATFKVFYTDQTPPDYEPPHFQPGDVEKDRWHFMTHAMDEVPERSSIGKIFTGHHSVNLSVTSIASYLPTSTEHDTATFMGTLPPGAVKTLTPAQEVLARKDQADKQLMDAEKRNVVWSSEDCLELTDEDAIGEDDPDYVRQPDGTYSKVDNVTIVGIRNEDGDITDVPPVEEAETNAAHFCGVSEQVPTRLGQIAHEEPKTPVLAETQPLETTPKNKRKDHASTPAASQSDSSISTLTPEPEFDPEMLKSMNINAPDDIEMLALDLETQAMQSHDPIESFPVEGIVSAQRAASVVSAQRVPEGALDCECGVTLEDECCFCEGGCGRWFHVWCMGYHAADDSRLPSRFFCFSCRAKKDVMWELIKFEIYPKMLANFKGLALFRRAIKVAEEANNFSLAEYATAFGSDVAQGRAMIQRLEDEGFISQEVTVVDDLGLQSTVKKPRGRPRKQPKGRKPIQKARYAFNRAIRQKQTYKDYFAPNDLEVEKRLLQVAELTKATRKPIPRLPSPEEESQTQPETQLVPPLLPKDKDVASAENAIARAKRRAEEAEAEPVEHPLKKVKISLAMVALAVAVRVLVALFTRTYFQPDEYFQSLEPAHRLVFGYGHLTWEWLNPTPIRSIIYPAINVPAYWLLELSGLSQSRWGSALVTYAPRVVHGALAALTDIFTAKLARSYVGDAYQSTAFFLSITSFFNALSLSRSLSNSLETSLCAVAFAYYPWDATSKLNPQLLQPSRIRMAILFSALACAIRPTNAVVWVFLYANLFWSLRKHLGRQLWLVAELLKMSGSALLLLTLVDSFYYGKLAFTTFNFLRTNLSSVSLFYGSNPWHYYVSQALPILCTTSLPFVLHGIYDTLRKSQSSMSRNRPLQTMLATVVWVAGVYSLAGHKEWRFIHPILPLLNVFAAKSLVDLGLGSTTAEVKSRLAEIKSKSKAKGKRAALKTDRTETQRIHTVFNLPSIRPSFLYFILATIPVSLFVVLGYCSAPISVMKYLRSIPKSELGPSTVGVLMPCHSIPGHAYLHRKQLANNGMWAIGCEPPLGGQNLAIYRSQTDIFFADPSGYLQTRFPPQVNPRFPASPFPTSVPGQPRSPHGDHDEQWRHEWPKYLVFFGNLLSQGDVANILDEKGYEEVWRAGMDWEGDDDKKKGGVRVWRWKGLRT